MAQTQQDVIKSFMKSLDTTNLNGVSAVNAAVKTASNSKFSTAQDVINQMVIDCQNAGSADIFLKKYCGIILDNEDTGAITGSDAGDSKTKTAESIVPESGILKNFTGSYFSTNGLTFQLSDYYSTKDYNKHAKVKSFNSLTGSQKFIWQSLYTWWGKESLNLITSSYGNNFGFTSSSSVDEINVGFYSASDGVLAYVQNWTEYDTGKVIGLDLAVNMYYYDNVDISDPNGSTSSYGAGYLDRTLAHEFTHAVMGANITNFKNLPLFIKEGMAELTHGIDDERYYDINSLASSSYSLRNALNLDITSGGTSETYAGGYMFLHYLAKQSANASRGSSSGSFKFTNGDDYYVNKTSNTVLNALGGDDTVNNFGADNVKLYVGNGNDSLLVAGNKDTIYGNSGKDFMRIYSDSESSKFYGGSGNDTFDGGGYENTPNGDSGNDYFKTYRDDSNTKIFGGSGKDTIYDGGIKTTINGGSGNDYVYLYTNAKSTKVIGGSGKDSIYSGASKASLNGGAGNDYVCIYNSASNTSVNGGTGNDTITNYSYYQTTYVYKNGDGNDVIDGFNFGTDKIKLTSGLISKKTVSGNDVILKIGKGSIRIKDGRGEKITVVNSNGKTKNYTTSTNSNVSKLWFDGNNSNSDIFGQSLDQLNSPAPSPDIESTSNNLISTPRSSSGGGIIVPTKYIIYADKK